MQIAVVDVGIEPALDTRADDLAAAAALAARADVAVVVVGSSSEWESEGGDRASIALPNGQDELVERVRAANPDTVVVLNCGAPMTLPWLDDVPACVLAWYPGQEAGDAITDVLTGAAEPGGRMPTTWARAEIDTPSYGFYPGRDGAVAYGEGVFVGYRGYDARGVDPLVPFGHGGSYTSFAWGPPRRVDGDGPVVPGEPVEIEVDVTNTGDRVGSDVVQVYAAPVDPVAERPVKELAGFAKVVIEPGATVTTPVRLRPRAFARWDPDTHRWWVDPGRYRLLVAASAVDVRGELGVDVAGGSTD